jgi:imidazolonepropionase-like amidohydrolase
MARTVFTGGRVFDGTGSPLRDADVVVEDGRIVDVGLRLDGDESIAVHGKTLLPGLFDCHTHIALTHLDLLKRLETPFSYRFYEAAQNLRTTLRLGITTVRDASGADLGIKQAVTDGLIRGPRLLISLVMISQTGGHGDGWMPSGVQAETLGVTYPGMPSNIVDGPEAMRQKVREIIRDGADLIKVATTGGVLSPRDDPRHGHFRDDELTTLVSEASAAGRWVMAHAQGAAGIKAAVRAGVRSIEHGVFLNDEAISMMLERGTFLVPTLIAPTGVLDAAAAGAAIPEASVRKARELLETHRDSFRKAVAAGVKIAMGTDCPVAPHGQNLRELQMMVDGGLTPAQALLAATSSAAELTGLSRELGTLEPGKRADLVVVDGDPLEFTTLPARIAAVYQDGRQVCANDAIL